MLKMICKIAELGTGTIQPKKFLCVLDVFLAAHMQFVHLKTADTTV